MKEIAKDIRYIGVDDLDLDLFESQYAVPDGMSYNSYLILDQKVAILDTADKRKGEQWLQNLHKALDGRKPDYLVTASDFQTEFFCKTFRIPESSCIKCGYPRSRILVCNEKERLAHIKAYEPASTAELISKIKGFSQTWIYMPTWRDSQRDIFAQNMDLGKLNEALAEKNELLLLKPHPNTIVRDLGAYPNIMLLDPSADVYPILPYTDVLVTDYSSVLYDYLLMDGKKVVLYLYDVKDYVKDRDFAYPFDENVTGQKVLNFEELLAAVKEGPKPVDPQERKALILKFWGPKPVDYDFSNYLHL